MNGVNKVILIGLLGKDPEVRYNQAGTASSVVSIATSEKWKDKQTGEQKETTEWHRVCFFGRLAEVVGEYLKKGSAIYVEGKIKTRKWIDNDSKQERYITEIIGSEMQMLSSRRDENIKPENKLNGNDFPGHNQSAFNDEEIPF